MRRMIIITFLFALSQHGYANCSNNTSEEMSYYRHMEQQDLKKEYCFCGKAMAYVKEAGRIADERNKIRRVLKKDYGVLEIECKVPPKG